MLMCCSDSHPKSYMSASRIYDKNSFPPGESLATIYNITVTMLYAIIQPPSEQELDQLLTFHQMHGHN